MKKTAVFTFASVVVVVVAMAAAGFACTSLATLNMSKASGVVGDPITVTGSSFAVSKADAAAPPVALHWNSLDGPVVAQATTDGSGSFTASFAVPQGDPGNYVVIARQLDAEGKDHYGSPARASFQLLAPGTQPVAAPVASTRAFSSEPSGASGAVALALGVGGLGLVLFGAGFMAVVRQTRRKAVPATAAAPQSQD